MSYQIPTSAFQGRDPLDCEASSGSEEDVEEEQSDWDTDIGETTKTKSLFDDLEYDTPEAALQHDREEHGFDLRATVEVLGLDMYGAIRLVNWMRKENRSSVAVKSLKPDDKIFTDDSLLIPVIVDDPLLQLDFDDSWSDDDGEIAPTQPSAPTDSERVQQLELQLEKGRNDLASLRRLVHDAVDNEGDATTVPINGSGKGKGKARANPERDDDTHYFESYAENDIHEIMLKDTTRTVSYGKYLLSNPEILKGAIVMDVGCGTGILSMFAARAGARHVYAIEASGLAAKARENIANNGLSSVITLIQGKVEDISLPVDKVDLIVSEWMGYMLLYESMLDSVLHARDRFLRTGGIMAPSQTRLVLSAITGERVWRERVDFWKSVYDFDMTTMNSVYFAEGLVEVVDASEVVTSECIVRDINTHTATPKSLDFSAHFSLASTDSKATTVRAFLTHFDTFFASHAEGQVSPEDTVSIVRHDDDEYTRPVTSTSGDTSFTTGPRGKETHWRQVVFLLQNAIHLQPGEKIIGVFKCHKSPTNSRELDVEIHHQILNASSDSGKIQVSVFKVR